MFGHTKKWRVAVIGALVLALPLAACTSKSSNASSTGASSGSSSAADQGTPVKGGTYTYDMEIAPQCSDPQVSPQFATQQFSRPVLDSLVSSSDGKTFKPWLATSWTISPDAKTYTFHLRSGVTFSDGTTLDAAAVKYNFDRIFAPATKSQYAQDVARPVRRYQGDRCEHGRGRLHHAASTPSWPRPRRRTSASSRRRTSRPRRPAPTPSAAGPT